MKRLATAFSCLLFVACIQSGESSNDNGRTDVDSPVCDDRDGDGYGEGCTAGGDCNDSDKSIHTGCSRCDYPQQGCGCSDGDKPISCYLSPSAGDEGKIMCHEGTRYCRGGQWSACESVVTYARTDTVDQGAVVDPDASRPTCNDCSVNCFVVRDNLDPTDAGLNSTSSNIASDGGGLTLTRTIPDAGTPDAYVFDPSKCIVGTAPDRDCDGIRDEYDPYPDEKPFATANPTLFLDIAPGQTGTGVVNLQFYLNSADVYFLMDQTSTMADERDRLKADLVSGNFINSSTYDCADYDFDLKPNNELKTKGLMGAIRCMIRDANFGVGYFREIPFSGYGSTDSVTFRNVQDVTSDIDKVTTAVGTLTTVGNSDYPEAGSMALNALVSAMGFDFGNDRTGVPARTDCPSNTFGTPCFRSKAIPIVLMFTDDPSHQGPASYPELYSTLTLTRGQNTKAIGSGYESYSTAYDLTGVDIANTFTAYTGSTSGMKSDFTDRSATCTNDGAGADVAFKFQLTATTTITASTAGSSFRHGLSILPMTPTALASYPNTNDSASNAYDFGTITNTYVQASGNSSGLTSDYSAADVSCGSAVGAKDAAFKLTVGGSGTTKVALDTTGSAFGTSVAVFSSTPATVSYTAITNSDTPYSFGAIDSKNLGVSANTSSGVTATHIATQLACSTAPADDALDADYTFSLAKAATVRVSTEGSTLDNVLALSKQPTAVTMTKTSGKYTNEAEATAQNVGVLDDAAVTYSASTASMTADYDVATTSCDTGTTKTSDATFKFTLNSTRTVTLDTTGSSINTVLSLFKTSIVTPTTVDATSKSYDTTGSPLDLGTVNNKSVTVTNATTTGLSANYKTSSGSSIVGCGAYDSSLDAVFKFTLSAATSVRIETTAAAFDSVLSVHSSTSPKPSNRLGCDADSSSALASLDLTSLSAGTYYVIVKSTANTKGAFTLSVRDLNIGLVDCNNDYSTRTSSSLTETLTAGTYYAVVRALSTASPSSGAYVLNLQDMATVSCDYASLGTGSSRLEQSLSAGTYRVTVKGKTTSDKNAYKLNVRDLTNVPTNLVSCDHNSGTSGVSHLETDLSPGTYFVVLKGDSSTSGAYTLSVRDLTNLPVATSSCDASNSSSPYTASLTTTLPKGTYYAVIKGYRSSSTYSGNFQLNIGGNTTFKPPTWSDTVALLQSKAVRVIPVLSCQDSSGKDGPRCAETRAQYKSLASDTGAIGSLLQTLQYDIHDDGSGLSNTVVTGVSELAKYLEMDVSARVVFDPDANPGFGVTVTAVDSTGDGCQGLVNNEHIQCKPGATPKFNVAFTNPVDHPVPLNSKDPNGGYNFRVELIGDDQFIVDQVPVYVIPQNVTTPTPDPQVASSGTYWQDLNSASCTGNLLPDWHDLAWNASIPDGTSVSFSVCTSDKSADLSGCTPTPLCTITGGAACTSDAMCSNGFCSTDGNCQTITGKSCSSSTECTAGASCKNSKCTFTGQPVYVGEVMGSGNYTANLRMFIGLTGNTTANTSPTVHNWSLSYVCNSAL